MFIERNQTYEMKNILSYRHKMNQEEINEKLNYLGKYISEHHLKKGKIVTTTYTIDIVDGIQVLDMEILCPVESVDSVPEGFVLKPFFRLTNALKLTHYGNPSLLQESIQEMVTYAKNEGYTPITSLYIVTVNEPRNIEDIDSMQIDLYMGITENIL